MDLYVLPSALVRGIKPLARVPAPFLQVQGAPGTTVYTSSEPYSVFPSQKEYST
jgi:hypothetical protein